MRLDIDPLAIPRYPPLMTAPHLISGLSDIAGQYDVVLSDVWGVIHNGRESFPEACAALERSSTCPTGR